MKSPFPGMDPYLERYWGEVHSRLIIYASDQLRPRLPRDLRARVQERLLVETPIGTERAIYPDVAISEEPTRTIGTATRFASDVAVATPTLFRLADQAVPRRYLEIIDAKSGGRVVTCIEFLSPTNKLPGPGHTQYLQKQEELLQARVNSVEIDLVRAGTRTFAYPAETLPGSYEKTFAACVWRARSPEDYELYRFPLRERLLGISVPLRPTDPDVALDLQALVDKTYENGGYEDIDYRAEPEPPLDQDDALWADALLRSAGRR